MEIRGVHQSFTKGKSNRLTFLEVPNTIYEVWVEKNNITGETVMRKEMICKLPLEAGQRVRTVYVYN